MKPKDWRERFDAMVEEVIASLPDGLAAYFDEIPVVVMDRPTREMLRDLGMDPSDSSAAEEICGLHTGVPETERSVEHSSQLPSQIHLFREGILNLVGWWEEEGADEEIFEEIRVTLLHELGHELGLDEDDLDRLGYG